MTTVAPFPLVEIDGAPRARGTAYGEQARGRIGASGALYA
ncbi:MAG: acyl-CoA--6-aminopenicillanic acid acyltransferase, partial [Mesorhizobium sp.]